MLARSTSTSLPETSTSAAPCLNRLGSGPSTVVTKRIRNGRISACGNALQPSWIMPATAFDGGSRSTQLALLGGTKRMRGM